MSQREQMDRAVERYEKATAELYRSDGTKLYSDEEHAERERAIRSEFKAAVDAIEQDVDSLIAAAKESLLIAESSDPTDALTTEELASANARRPFVSDEVFTLPMEKLVDRCRAVLAQGDRPAMFLYALYGGQRAGLTGDESPYSPRYNTPTDDGETGGGEETGPLLEVVSELWRKLNPDAHKRVESAQKKLDELGGLKDYAYLRRRGAKNALELYTMQTYNTPGRH
jgi:hypothetical protein